MLTALGFLSICDSANTTSQRLIGQPFGARLILRPETAVLATLVYETLIGMKNVFKLI
ncbi:hypothetical protein [Propionispira raffinosivorans]|uniref:hypothetical protein n=1 Tax=Propionispira raffinosivorans TaxID=86959 RepID=UPI00035C6859|nr:hypothetical protein [Propionispira raffinosivorans]